MFRPMAAIAPQHLHEAGPHVRGTSQAEGVQTGEDFGVNGDWELTGHAEVRFVAWPGLIRFPADKLPAKKRLALRRSLVHARHAHDVA